VAITAGRLRQFAQQFPDAAAWLDAFRYRVNRATWRNISELRADYPSADPVRLGDGKTVYVFNVCGNKYRLVVAVHFNIPRVVILRMMTHAEYSKERWKDELR
jgi:mRNA interferase HigB